MGGERLPFPRQNRPRRIPGAISPVMMRNTGHSLHFRIRAGRIEPTTLGPAIPDPAYIFLDHVQISYFVTKVLIRKRFRPTQS
jgi:hypothetical protein